LEPSLEISARITVFTILSILLWICFLQIPVLADSQVSAKRVPAEWEPQEAIWLQWPGRWEKTYETAFARISSVISNYQKLHILYSSDQIKQQARKAISGVGENPDHANLTWHNIVNDSAWMRDNGPVYIEEAGKIKIQDWGFDAWGGAFGKDIPYQLDDKVPAAVASYLSLAVQDIDIVHERGNLEFNGADSVILNWSVLGDSRRNPGYTKKQAEADLKKYFGVSRVVFVEGIPQGDLTNGHIDGIARFINPATVVVPDCTLASKCQPDDGVDDAVYDAAAASIKAAGFKVIRDPIEGIAKYNGQEFDTNYMNWMVGNGFVIAVGFGSPQADMSAKMRLQQ